MEKVQLNYSDGIILLHCFIILLWQIIGWTSNNSYCIALVELCCATLKSPCSPCMMRQLVLAALGAKAPSFLLQAATQASASPGAAIAETQYSKRTGLVSEKEFKLVIVKRIQEGIEARWPQNRSPAVSMTPQTRTRQASLQSAGSGGGGCPLTQSCRHSKLQGYGPLVVLQSA